MMNYQQLRIFNSYCDPHSQGFTIVNEAEVVFLEFAYFPCDPTNVGNLISPLPILPGLPWLSDKESTCKCRRHGFDPWSWKIPQGAGRLSQSTSTTEPARPNWRAGPTCLN